MVAGQDKLIRKTEMYRKQYYHRMCVKDFTHPNYIKTEHAA
jgi:hypothetical protein